MYALASKTRSTTVTMCRIGGHWWDIGAPVVPHVTRQRGQEFMSSCPGMMSCRVCVYAVRRNGYSNLRHWRPFGNSLSDHSSDFPCFARQRGHEPASSCSGMTSRLFCVYAVRRYGNLGHWHPFGSLSLITPVTFHVLQGSEATSPRLHAPA